MYLFTRDSWWPAGLTRLTNHQHLTKLQQKVPIIASFLTGLSKAPVQVYNVLCELVAVIDATFQHADAMTRTLPQVTTHHLWGIFPAFLSFVHQPDMKLTCNFLRRRQTPVESCHMATQLYLLVSSPSIASMGFVMAIKLWHNANLQKFRSRSFSLAFPNLLMWLSMIMDANCMSTAWIKNLGTFKTHSSW